jgi:hypothetical protein
MNQFAYCLPVSIVFFVPDNRTPTHVDHITAVVSMQRRKARERSSSLAILFVRSVVKEKYEKTEGCE